MIRYYYLGKIRVFKNLFFWKMENFLKTFTGIIFQLNENSFILYKELVYVHMYKQEHFKSSKIRKNINLYIYIQVHLLKSLGFQIFIEQVGDFPLYKHKWADATRFLQGSEINLAKKINCDLTCSVTLTNPEFFFNKSWFSFNIFWFLFFNVWPNLGIENLFYFSKDYLYLIAEMAF